ncbi:MAG: hypothetical protein K2L42_06055 [Clostridia bacterium]|nr:hypothetical protein [Clostridia bacterium]
MKKSIKSVLFSAAALALCFAFTGCGNVPPAGDGNGNGEASSWQDNMHRDDNDFLEDDNRRPSRDPFVDNTPEDDGENKTTYRFEAERAKILGTTNGENHFCTAKSTEFSPSFSGNVTLCNLGTATLSYTFDSDKAVRSTMHLRMSSQYAGSTGGVLGSYANITVNDKPVVDLTAAFDTEEPGEPASGCSASYFTMVTLETKVSLAKGRNVLAITPVTANYLNLDYFEIETSAAVEDKTVPTVTNPSSFVNVTKVPTETATGTVAFTCHNKKEAGEEVVCKNDNARARNLPALTDGIYTKNELANGTQHAAKIYGEDVVIASTVVYTLTLTEGATFEDGSTSGKVAPGDKPALKYTTPDGQVFSHWEDAEGNKLASPFVMPEKDITIKPVFVDASTAVTVTLQGATLNGSSTVKVSVNGTVDLSDAEITNQPENTYVSCWFNVADATECYDDASAIPVAAEDITLAPVFDAAPISNANNFVGKITQTGNLFGGTGKVNGCYSVTKNMTTGAVNSGNGYYELGSIYHFKGGTAAAPANMEVGAHFLTQEMNGKGLTQGNLDSAHTVSTTVENFGSESVTLRFALIKSSGDPNNSQYGEKTVTIPAGETVTFTFDISYMHASLMLNMMVKDHAVSEVFIGVYQYISVSA